VFGYTSASSVASAAAKRHAIVFDDFASGDLTAAADLKRRNPSISRTLRCGKESSRQSQRGFLRLTKR
jgi:hypothetical protein